MPWSLSNLPNSVKNKSKELKEIFIEVSNRSLSEGKDDEASLFAGLAAVSNAERKKAKEIKKQQLEDKLKASYVPEHLRLIQEAKALKEIQKKQEEEQQELVFKEKIKSIVLEELKDDLLNGTKQNFVVNAVVQGDELILVYSNGKRQKVPILNVIQNVAISASTGGDTYTTSSPTETEVGGVPVGTTFSNTPIQQVFDMLFYKVSVSMYCTPAVAEIGSTVQGAILTFGTTGTVDSLALDEFGDVTGETSQVIPYDITANKLWTITATSGDIVKQASAGVQFLNRVFYGVTPNVSPSEAEILNVVGNLSGTKPRTVTYDCSVGTGQNRFFYAYPKRLGVITDVKVNNLEFTDYNAVEMQITNQSGYTEDYYVYTNSNLLGGSAVRVQWS
jgi:uncharacterized protein YdaT